MMMCQNFYNRYKMTDLQDAVKHRYFKISSSSRHIAWESNMFLAEEDNLGIEREKIR